MNRVFDSYGPYCGNIPGRRNGVLISNAHGESSAYALWNLQERGKIFISPNTQIYEGMIIGEHSRENDLEVNPLKAKQLSNVRASGKDEAIVLTPPIIMTLEQSIAYIDDDELVEVTPKSIRLTEKTFRS
jgi:GTP-binding protein